MQRGLPRCSQAVGGAPRQAQARGFYVDVSKSGQTMTPVEIKDEPSLRDVIEHVHQLGWQLRLGEHIEAKSQAAWAAAIPPASEAGIEQSRQLSVGAGIDQETIDNLLAARLAPSRTPGRMRANRARPAGLASSRIWPASGGRPGLARHVTGGAGKAGRSKRLCRVDGFVLSRPGSWKCIWQAMESRTASLLWLGVSGAGSPRTDGPLVQQLDRSPASLTAVRVGELDMRIASMLLDVRLHRWVSTAVPRQMYQIASDDFTVL